MQKFQRDTLGNLTEDLVSVHGYKDPTDKWGENDMTNVNEVEFVDGLIGGCAQFDGVTNYLHRAAVLSAQTNNISMLCWVDIPTVTERGCFFKNGRDGDNLANPTNGYGIGVGLSTMDNLGNNLIGICEAVGWLNFDKTIGTGSHFLAITRGVSVWKGYVDAVVSATTFTTNPVIPTLESFIGVADPVHPAPIPGSPITERFWRDKIGIVLFYNRELNQTEIDDHFNNGFGNPLINPAGTGAFFRRMKK